MYHFVISSCNYIILNYLEWSLILCLVLSLSFLNVIIGPELLCLALLTVLGVLMLWFRDLSRESVLSIADNLSIGYWLIVAFIGSEFLLFISFFWALIHNSNTYLVSYIADIDSSNIIIVNTILLSYIGTSNNHITYVNHMNINYTNYIITIIASIIFIALFALEVFASKISFTDIIVNQILYILVSLHVSHVVVGLILLSNFGNSNKTILGVDMR